MDGFNTALMLGIVVVGPCRLAHDPGKTTTMRMICGLLAPDRGSVSWGGAPIDGRARERIGYMPGERGLYPKMRRGDQLEYFAVLHGASHARARACALLWLQRLRLGDQVPARVEAPVLLSSAGLIVLTARAYERAILRLGAPVKRGRLLAYRSHRGRRDRISHPVAIVLMAVGLVLLMLVQSLQNWPRRPAH